MTFVTPESKQETILKQEPVDIKKEQQQVDLSLGQQKPQEESKQTEKTDEDPNWKAFREARKKDRAEREAAERRAVEKEAEVTALKAAMEAAFTKNSPSPQQYQQYYSQNQHDQPEETEDERIEKKVQAAIAAREAAADKARLEREQREYPQRLEQAFPDFKSTINQDTLDYLDYHFPEVSRPLQRLPDGFDKWSDIYRAVKKFVPNQSTAKKDVAKADANFNKPKSISSQGLTQPGDSTNRGSFQEIDARRQARYAEMKKIINAVG